MIPRGYWTRHDICSRYNWSATTLYRRLKRATNPFPPPTFYQKGAPNQWAIDEVLAWEENEKIAVAV